MSQISASELLAQLKLFASHPPESLSQDVDLRVQLYHASREAMLAFESAPDPITRIAVAQVSLVDKKSSRRLSFGPC